ncbi:hypothetical protein [Longimicrobium sp.]|uniref:hypothetical protein n=1 Tax=Longimicrobium sp. TaxID=2029185 RepID=UPI002D140B89|nr:hypothetical protein [Longimicrobium sp.]HSU15703.1 hypothetical protein [Longimicrobium sp.]
MSQLVEVLYPVPDLRRTPLSTLRWWESRRLLFNKVVGATGLATLACVSLFLLLPPHTMGAPQALPMLAFAAAYAVAANACYTMGWLLELAARAVWGRRAPDVGPLLFRQGLIFAVGLTLMPVILVSMIWVIHVVLAIVS